MEIGLKYAPVVLVCCLVVVMHGQGIDPPDADDCLTFLTLSECDADSSCSHIGQEGAVAPEQPFQCYKNPDSLSCNSLYSAQFCGLKSDQCAWYSNVTLCIAAQARLSCNYHPAATCASVDGCKVDNGGCVDAGGSFEGCAAGTQEDCESDSDCGWITQQEYNVAFCLEKGTDITCDNFIVNQRACVAQDAALRCFFGPGSGTDEQDAMLECRTCPAGQTCDSEPYQVDCSSISDEGGCITTEYCNWSYDSNTCSVCPLLYNSANQPNCDGESDVDPATCPTRDIATCRYPCQVEGTSCRAPQCIDQTSETSCAYIGDHCEAINLGNGDFICYDKTEPFPCSRIENDQFTCDDRSECSFSVSSAGDIDVCYNTVDGPPCITYDKATCPAANCEFSPLLDFEGLCISTTEFSCDLAATKVTCDTFSQCTWANFQCNDAGEPFSCPASKIETCSFQSGCGIDANNNNECVECASCAPPASCNVGQAACESAPYNSFCLWSQSACAPRSCDDITIEPACDTLAGCVWSVEAASCHSTDYQFKCSDASPANCRALDSCEFAESLGICVTEVTCSLFGKDQCTSEAVDGKNCMYSDPLAVCYSEGSLSCDVLRGDLTACGNEPSCKVVDSTCVAADFVTPCETMTTTDCAANSDRCLLFSGNCYDLSSLPPTIINPCTGATPLCDSLTTCVDQPAPGDYNCTSCPFGYNGDGRLSSGGCKEDEVTCPEFPYDDNMEPGICKGELSCLVVCKTGFREPVTGREESTFTCDENGEWNGDALDCQSEQNCAANPCQEANQECEDVDDGYVCSCKSGFEESPTGCINTNECNNGSPCEGNATCVDTEGAYECKCDAGHAGDNCEACLPGYVQPDEGSRGCVPCDVNQYQDEYGQRTCKDCEAGTVQPSRGAHMCFSTDCPAPSLSQNSMLEDASCGNDANVGKECTVVCGPGFTAKSITIKCDDRGLWAGIDDVVCAPLTCPGIITADFLSKAIQIERCANVSIGDVCSASNFECAQGYSRTGGQVPVTCTRISDHEANWVRSTNAGDFCSACDVGTYQDEGTLESCKTCDGASFQDETGQSSCKNPSTTTAEPTTTLPTSAPTTTTPPTTTTTIKIVSVGAEGTLLFTLDTEEIGVESWTWPEEIEGTIEDGIEKSLSSVFAGPVATIKQIKVIDSAQRRRRRLTAVESLVEATYSVSVSAEDGSQTNVQSQLGNFLENNQDDILTGIQETAAQNNVAALAVIAVGTTTTTVLTTTTTTTTVTTSTTTVVTTTTTTNAPTTAAPTTAAPTTAAPAVPTTAAGATSSGSDGAVDSSTTQTPGATDKQSEEKGDSTGSNIPIIAGIVAGVAIITLIVFLLYRRSHKGGSDLETYTSETRMKLMESDNNIVGDTNILVELPSSAATSIQATPNRARQGSFYSTIGMESTA